MRKIATTYKAFHEMLNESNGTEYFVKTGPDQYAKVHGSIKKKSDTYLIGFENDYEIVVGDRHMFMDMQGNPIAAENLKPKAELKTINGSIKVTSKSFNEKDADVYDIWIDYPHWYINDEHLGVYHHNTMLALYAMKAYLDKYPDGVGLFYDSEFGSPSDYMSSIGIDVERVVHIPVTNIEELKFDMVSRLEAIERGDHVFIMVDSIGNLASKKEYENAMNENSSKDMTRAQEIKSFFRITTPHITMKNLSCLIIAHTYKEMASMYPKDVISGGCVVPGTLIATDQGLKAIEHVKKGMKVRSHEGWKEVLNVWTPETLENGHPTVYRLVFSDGFKLICSGDHKLLSTANEWIAARDMMDENEEPKQLMFRGLDGSKLRLVDIVELGEKDVYDLEVEDAHSYMHPNGLISHNSGVMYSCNTAFIITKSQIKEGSDLAGYTYTIHIEKSRYVREKAKLPFDVTYNGGINKWSGLLQLAIDGGFVVKPSNGWYQKVGEEKKYRQKDTNCDEFFGSILADQKFKDYIKARYQLGAAAPDGEMVDPETGEVLNASDDED